MGKALLSSLLLGPLLAAAVARPAAGAELDAPCAPARVTSPVAALPDEWRRALDALVEASARRGLPWSCSNARLALAPPDLNTPAKLTVALDDWQVMKRDIEDPEDLVPEGEALLARLVASRPSARIDPAPALPSPSGATRDRAATGPADAGITRPPPAYSDPRLLADALFYTRYSGGVRAFWMGAELRAALPIEGWYVGIWGRYELAVATLEPVITDFSVESGSIGLALGRRLVPRPIELWATLEPSVALVTMDGGVDGTPESANGARGDVRIGARLQAAIWLGPRWRALVALDGEVSPWALASEAHRTIAPILPQIPSYSLGASIGGELSVR